MKDMTYYRSYTKNKTKATVISVDTEKAFDSVNWDFLCRVLIKFGFHDTLFKLYRHCMTALQSGLRSMDIY